jgi:hypothetical protein
MGREGDVVSLRDEAEERDEDRHLAAEHRDLQAGTYRLPESHAANRLADLVATHLQPQWFTHQALLAVMKKVVANRTAVLAVFSELDAGPTIDAPTTLLRQQQVNRLDDVDYWLETVSDRRRELADAEKILARVLAAHTGGLVDRDGRGADEDDEVRKAERYAGRGEARVS